MVSHHDDNNDENKRINLQDLMLFKQMNPTVYNGICLFIFIVLIGMGMMIDDLGIVFEFVSSFNQVFLSFIGPGYFFLLAESMFGDPKLRE